jgi:hypothetical protein
MMYDEHRGQWFSIVHILVIFEMNANRGTKVRAGHNYCDRKWFSRTPEKWEN